MKTPSLSDIKKELSLCHQQQLIELCLRMAKFKKINKELLNYLLFEAQDESAYIKKIKGIIEERFNDMPFNSLFFTTKYIRKTLRITKQYSQYSGNKLTETELMIFFCTLLKKSYSQWRKYSALCNLYERLVAKITKDIATLHEDLQYDYQKEVEKLQL
ncbi:MAG: hypothetical protein H7296_11215 [Bacteroidia bacterium]|nr:hypothetical protein [Bacteroidia bacterium]